MRVQIYNEPSFCLTVASEPSSDKRNHRLAGMAGLFHSDVMLHDSWGLKLEVVEDRESVLTSQLTENFHIFIALEK